MKKRKRNYLPYILILLVAAAFAAFLLSGSHFGYAREVSHAEVRTRDAIVGAAIAWKGCNELDGSHHPIIDLYNSHTPLARDYPVTYEDDWCSAYVSAIAIQCGMTDIIPTECGCERHIECFMEIDAWEEDDDYIPLPGDYIFYSKETGTGGDNTGWAEHVGIVVGTWNNWIKVIEGNKEDAVTYRYIPIGDWIIRGYGVPDYASFTQ